MWKFEEKAWRLENIVNFTCSYIQAGPISWIQNLISKSCRVLYGACFFGSNSNLGSINSGDDWIIGCTDYITKIELTQLYRTDFNV